MGIAPQKPTKLSLFNFSYPEPLLGDASPMPHSMGPLRALKFLEIAI